MSERIYCVVMPTWDEAESKAISELCWGSCGKGIVGAIDIQIDADRGVACIPCREATCPHVEREVECPELEVHGDQVTLRKVKIPEVSP